MAEKHQVDKSIDELVDIRDVKLDSRVGDVVVNVAYTEGGPTLNDCFADMLSLL